MGIVVHTHTSSAKEVEMKGTSGLTGQPVQTNWSVKDPVSKTKVEMYVVVFFFFFNFIWRTNGSQENRKGPWGVGRHIKVRGTVD